MSVLYVVRHGQASFMSDDYDRLSPLGTEQAKTLGQKWLASGVQPTHVFAGSLKRQQDSAAGVRSAFDAAGVAFPECTTLPGLNEYPAEILVEQFAPRIADAAPQVRRWMDALSTAAPGDEQYRAIHRLLEETMTAWVSGEHDVSSLPLPTWQSFSDTVRDALARTRVNTRGATVAVFTSGGPVGIAVQSALGAPEQAAAALNWRVHNASVTKFTYSQARLSLDSFNVVSHLSADQLTYR